jgi:hypothetical protein
VRGQELPAVFVPDVPRRSGAVTSPHRGDDLGELGKTPLLPLREDDLALGEHVELPAAAWDHLGGVTEAVQLGRETRGPFVVAASGRAVEDADLRHPGGL